MALADPVAAQIESGEVIMALVASKVQLSPPLRVEFVTFLPVSFRLTRDIDFDRDAPGLIGYECGQRKKLVGFLRQGRSIHVGGEHLVDAGFQIDQRTQLVIELRIPCGNASHRIGCVLVAGLTRKSLATSWCGPEFPAVFDGEQPGIQELVILESADLFTHVMITRQRELATEQVGFFRDRR